MKQIINITEKDTDVLKHLRKQDNISKYILRLVRQDMKNENKEDQIRMIVADMLKNLELKSEKPNIDVQVIDSISNVLGF